MCQGLALFTVVYEAMCLKPPYSQILIGIK